MLLTSVSVIFHSTRETLGATEQEEIIVVIELKSMKTKDLKTIEKQAFNYKAHQSNCKYIITSNFEKIRLYINDATEFEE